MIEAIVTGVLSLVVGAGTGVLAVNSRSNSRMDALDKRIDGLEIRLAENYVQKQELSRALQKMEDHMIRIETKLDQMMMKNG